MFRYLHFPENLHHGICLKTPTRTSSASRNATSTAQVSSDSFHLLAVFPATASVLITILLTNYITDGRCNVCSSRSLDQYEAPISATSCDATRPTISKAGAGSFSSLASAATLDQRTCWWAPLARATITHGTSAGSPPASHLSSTSA